MRSPAACTVLLLAIAGSAAAGSADSVPFRLRGNGDVLVAVTIDGHGPFDFLLDTGSSRSAVSTDVARRLGRPASAQTLMVTPSGQAMRPLALLEHIRLGATAPVNVWAMVLTAGDLSRGTPIDGLIGQDVLAGLTYTIDYRRRRLIWHTAPEPELAGTRLPLEMHEGRFLVSLAQKSGACGPLQLIPDSGTDGLVLFPRPGRTLPAFVLRGPAGLSTLSGARLVRSVVVDDLDVGDIRLRNQLAVILDRGQPHAALGDGLLPLHWFERVTFNGPGRYLIVNAPSISRR